MKSRGIIILGVILLTWVGCDKETVSPEIFGSIEGQVQNSNTGEAIAFVSIITNPGTNAILTDENGQFSINEIPTGNYTIQADKENYDSKTVRVAVKEDRTAIAQILLSRNEDAGNAAIDTEVSNFFNTSSNDSMFVEVDYVLWNSGSNEILNYEVYFKIHTEGPSFYEEVRGDSLGSGEQTIGSFKKYIRQYNADSVTISGVYAPRD